MNLDILAHIAEIIIALGTIFSIWFSIKTLRSSDWNSLMATAPSITIEPYQVHLGRSEYPSGGYSWGEPTFKISKSDTVPYVVLDMDFRGLNQGKGIALSIKKLKVESSLKSVVKQERVPLTKGTEKDHFTFGLEIREKFDVWLKNPSVKMVVSVEYLNDQSNILCKTTWSSVIKPFDVENGELGIRSRDDRFYDTDIAVDYKWNKNN